LLKIDVTVFPQITNRNLKMKGNRPFRLIFSTFYVSYFSKPVPGIFWLLDRKVKGSRWTL
jgi:hypothetical protein